MAKRVMCMVLSCVALVCFSNLVLAAEINVLEYPKNVAPGQSANVKISWKDVPTDKDYILRVQLEDWDAKPAVCIFKDMPLSQTSGEASVSIPIPKNVGGTNAAKFVAVALSKARAWDDVSASNGTEKDVVVSSSFKFDIVDFPKTVNKGSTAKIKVSWKDVSAGKDYKLIVQLENWDAKPGFAYVATSDDFKPTDEATFDIKLPANSPAAKNCRFVAAFISKTKEWNDVFAFVSTEKDIEVK